MAKAAAQFIGLRLIPVVRQFDHAMLRLLAITDEGQTVLTVRNISLAQELHAHWAGIESERLVEIQDADHCVQHAVVGGVIGHFSLPTCRGRGSCRRTWPPPPACPRPFPLPKLSRHWPGC